MSFTRVAIAALNKKSLKDIADLLHDQFNSLWKIYRYIQ